MEGKRFTKLEEVIFAHPRWRALASDADRAAKQAALDAICAEALCHLNGFELCESVAGVYDETVEEYGNNPHTKYIIDDMARYMRMLASGSLVLDVGCGPGRDTFYMSISSRRFREGLMGRAKEKDGKTTLDKFPAPPHTFRVVGIDGAGAMIEAAKTRLAALEREYGIADMDGYPRFAVMDMHDNLAYLLRDRANRPLRFDGVWSCTALFTHTPRPYLHSVMSTMARLLKPGGIFYVSYTNGRVDGKYDKLILSSTGRIKWFSQPDPDEIVAIAAENGLRLMEESTFDDYAKGSDFAKDLFVSHFFRKEG